MTISKQKVASSWQFAAKGRRVVDARTDAFQEHAERGLQAYRARVCERDLERATRQYYG